MKRMDGPTEYACGRPVTQTAVLAWRLGPLTLLALQHQVSTPPPGSPPEPHQVCVGAHEGDGLAQIGQVAWRGRGGGGREDGRGRGQL